MTILQRRITWILLIATYLPACPSVSLSQKPMDSIAPLIQAAQEDDLDKIKTLLKQGADVNTRDEKGQTALVWACRVTRHDPSQWTPRKRRVVQLLLAAGANPNVADEYGMTALSHLCHYGQVELVRAMLEHGAQVNAHFPEPPPLFDARDSAAIVRLLLARGAKIEAKDDIGDTPLIDAAFSGSVSVVRQLLRAGANVQAENNHGDTALMMAAGRQSPGGLEIVQMLLAHKVKVNHKNEYGNTALHSCTAFPAKDCLQIARLLLKHGANVNAVNQEGRTALWSCMTNMQYPTIQLLLDKGIDVHIKDKQGKTALDFLSGEVKMHAMLNKPAAARQKHLYSPYRKDEGNQRHP